MGHVLALLTERHLGVRARVGFDGHESNHEALVRRDLDLYIEYTGTVHHRFLGLPHAPRDRVYEIVRTEARARWDLEWFRPLGFDNTYGVVLPAETAQDLGTGRISDLRAHVGALRLGAVSAFFTGGPETRFAPGGHAGFGRTYGFAFPQEFPIPPEYGATTSTPWWISSSTPASSRTASWCSKTTGDSSQPTRPARSPAGSLSGHTPAWPISCGHWLGGWITVGWPA